MAPPAAIDNPVALSDDVYSKVAEFKFVFPEESSPPASPAAPKQAMSAAEAAPVALTIRSAGEAGSLSLKRESPDGPEGSAEGKRRRYCLVLVDEKTGKPQRPATEEEAAELQRTLASLLQQGQEKQQQQQQVKQEKQQQQQQASGTSPHSLRPRREASQQHLREQREAEQEPLPAHHHLSYNRAHWHHHQKPGGPCDHCGAVESPQWRRGPTHKPVLCNACGTRFRRTHQLGVPSSPGNGKGRGDSSCFKRGKGGREQPVMVYCHS